MFSPSIQKLIDIFSKFPTVGPKTAARFVFYLLKLSNEEISKITSAISTLKDNVKLCSSCFNSFEGERTLCNICNNPARDESLLCIVEKESDLEAIERIQKYNGLYFVLGGTASALKKNDLTNLRIKELESKIEDRKDLKEIIVATNPTSEGEAVAIYLMKTLKKDLPLTTKLTRLGLGLPLGGEIEYADEETITSALEGRR